MDALRRSAVRAAAGHRDALDTLLAALYPVVRRFCAAMVAPGDADDVTQEAMIRVVRALPAYRADASVTTWALAIARHTCLDQRRSTTRRRAAESRLRAEPPATVAGPAEHVGVEELVATLAPERREAFVLTGIVGLSYVEAAAVCGCPVGSIGSRVARARGDLLDLLAAAERRIG